MANFTPGWRLWAQKMLDPGNDTQQSTLQKRLPNIQSRKYDPILNRNTQNVHLLL